MSYMALIVLGIPMLAVGQTAEKPIVEKLEHGEINWTEKTVLATGSGAPDLKLPNVAAVRLNAERAAKLSAYRNVLETLQGIRVSAKVTGKQALSQGQVRTQVEGIIRGCKIVDTRYYSDGGVDVVLRCPLNGGLATSLAPVKDHTPVAVKGPSTYSGLVIDATGLSMKPALQPRVLDAGGVQVYAASMISPNALRQHGAASFVRSVEAAKQLARIGSKPLVIKAMRVGKAPSDLIVDPAAVADLKKADQSFLAEAKVAIVTGEP